MPAESGDRRTEVSVVVDAPRAAVYRAFLDPEAVAAWLPPAGMTGEVHRFDPREGGEFRLSLTYRDPADSPDGAGGKTTGGTDTHHGRFVRLIPDEEIVEVVEFESDDPGFAGEMRITVTLADVDGGTRVTYRCEDVPPGIRLADNEAGCRSSLDQLAALVEGPEGGDRSPGTAAVAITADERAVRDLVGTWMEATEAGDVETVLELVTDDVVFTVPGREPFGREAFEAMLAGVDGMDVAGTSEVRELEVHGDWAYVRTYIELTTTPPDGEPAHRSGWTLSLLRRGSDGRWRLARDANLVTDDPASGTG